MGTTDRSMHDTLLATYSDLVNKVIDQNNKIDEQIEKYQQQHSTDYKKSVYEMESTESLQVIYNYLFYVYYFVVLILFFYIMMNGALFKPMNIGIVVLLLLFPFIILPIETFVADIFRYFYSFFTQNVYSNVYL